MSNTFFKLLISTIFIRLKYEKKMELRWWEPQLSTAGSPLLPLSEQESSIELSVETLGQIISKFPSNLKVVWSEAPQTSESGNLERGDGDLHPIIIILSLPCYAFFLSSVALENCGCLWGDGIGKGGECGPGP